ncbi:MAG: MFS transporter [Ardenticatenaceae bacterium]|nr:MFS transporter [Ardenticatenaceae bacterium]
MIRPKLMLRWLLQMDQPVPPRNEAEIEAEIERHYRWNYWVNLLDGGSFWFGASFISSATIVPLFVSKLTDSPVAIGITAVIAQASWYLPQLFTANLVERLPRKKPVVVNLGFFTERLPLFFMTFAAVLAARSPIAALWLFLLAYAWHGLGAGIIATAWQDLIARCFPVERRGRFFGTTMFVGAGTGALSASFSAWLLDHYPFPTNFVIVFAIATASIMISLFFIALTREPAQPVTTPRRSRRQYRAELGHILRSDVNFRRFLVARWTYALGTMGIGFVTVAAIHRWQVPDRTVGLFTLMYLIGQTIGNLLFGYLADHFGHKLSLELSAALAGMAYLAAWFVPSPAWYFVIFILLGMNLGATIVSGILIVMEFASPEKRPTYAGLVNTTVGIFSFLAPLIGTSLAGVSYGVVFVLGGIINLVCWLLLRFWVKEPRWGEGERPFTPTD